MGKCNKLVMKGTWNQEKKKHLTIMEMDGMPDRFGDLGMDISSGNETALLIIFPNEVLACLTSEVVVNSKD